MPPSKKYWLLNGRRRKTVSKKSNKNIKVDDETIKQIKDLIKIYTIVQQTVGYEENMFERPFSNLLSLFKDTLKILERNKKIEKDKEDTKAEFDVWFNSRKQKVQSKGE